MDFIGELWKFLRKRKKLWLFPLVLTIVVLGVLLVAAQGSLLSPFIYTLF